MLAKLLNDAIELNQYVFPIHIESPGGDVNSMNAMLGLIDSARGKGMKIATITSGSAMSAGALIFSYGDHGLRFIGEYGVIMFHSFSLGGLEGKVGECKHLSDQSLVDQDKIFNKISKHLKKRGDWLSKKLKSNSDYDWYLSAEEAVKEGVASTIGLPTFSLSINVGLNINI